jgi:hypothetical protein
LDDEVNIKEKLDMGDSDGDLFSSWEIDDSVETVGVMMQDSQGSGNGKKMRRKLWMWGFRLLKQEKQNQAGWVRRTSRLKVLKILK